MGIPRKEKERQQRRALLLEAAAAVFGRKPFDEATMQEVAAEAEIGMQGLYEHFPSKQDLYEQLMTYRADEFRQRVDQALQGLRAPLDQLKVLASVYVSHYREQPMLMTMFIRDRVQHDWGIQSRFTGRLRDIYEEEMGRLHAILEAATGAGLLRPQDPEFLARFCLGALEASLLAGRNQPQEPVAACVDRAMGAFLDGAGVRS